MSLSEPLRIGLMTSLGLHAVLLAAFSGFEAPTDTGRSFVRLNLESTEALVVDEAGILSLDAFTTPATAQEEKLAENRRRTYNEYLDAVSLEIHSHRLQFGHEDLIGIVTYAFVIDSDGSFSDIRLRRTSGNPELDRVALRAIEVSSQRVPRPKLLGVHPIAVVQEIRFQYGLR